MSLSPVKPKHLLESFENRLYRTFLAKSRNANEEFHSNKGEIIAVTYEKSGTKKKLIEKINSFKKEDVIFLQSQTDYEVYKKKKKEKGKKNSNMVVALEPSSWPNWRKIAHKFLIPKKDTVFVVDNSMEVMYCANREIRVSKNGDVEKERGTNFV